MSDGVVASIVLVSAFLTCPLAWRDRLLGGLIGYAIIFGLNLLRILSLFLLGVSGYRQAFNFGNTYVSQFAVVIVTMIFWIFWIGRERIERD
jgi:exosortase/archaeosortase family protein